MRLTLHTDYALRVLIYAGLSDGRLVTISEIAEFHGISKNHLTKVVHQLGKAGFLETVRGKYGGLRLMRAPKDISLGAFVRATEDDFAVARCMRVGGARAGDDGEVETCRLDATCLARHAFTEGIAAFFGALDRYTLADILAGQRLGVGALPSRRPGLAASSG